MCWSSTCLTLDLRLLFLFLSLSWNSNIISTYKTFGALVSPENWAVSQDAWMYQYFAERLPPACWQHRGRLCAKISSWLVGTNRPQEGNRNQRIQTWSRCKPRRTLWDNMSSAKSLSIDKWVCDQTSILTCIRWQSFCFLNYVTDLRVEGDEPCMRGCGRDSTFILIVLASDMQMVFSQQATLSASSVLYRPGYWEAELQAEGHRKKRSGLLISFWIDAFDRDKTPSFAKYFMRNKSFTAVDQS